MFGISEIAILIIVCILIFGAKKLPELARNAGKSARILKAEAKALKKEKQPGGTGTAAGASPEPDGDREVLEGKVVPRPQNDEPGETGTRGR